MMESSEKGRNPWRRNQSQIRASNSYRQPTEMPQDTGMANNYSNHYGQPSYQVSRMPQSTWYGARSNPETTTNPDSWNWGIDPQQNPGQHFQEPYHTGAPPNYSQPQQQQSLYQGYEHQTQPPVDVSTQQLHMQWSGMYQGQHGMPMNNMGYQQYDQSHPSNMDNMNQANVGNLSVTGNGNGTGDLWNWGIDDAQAGAGEWGGNEEAWDWTIPGADTPNSVPTPVPTPGPPQQRLVQGSAEEAYQPVLEKVQANDMGELPAMSPANLIPQANQVPSNEVGGHHITSFIPSSEVPNVSDGNVSQLHSESINARENEGNLVGWSEDSPIIEASIITEEAKSELEDAVKENVIRECGSNSPQTDQQENVLGGNVDNSNPTLLEASVQNCQQLQSDQLNTASANQRQSQVLPDVNQNPGVFETNQPSNTNENDLLQDFTVQQHTDANHNELLLLEVSHQINEESQSYDMWWQTPERNLSPQSNLDGSQHQKTSAESEIRHNGAEINRPLDEPKQVSPKKVDVQGGAHSTQDIQWPQRLESNNSLIQLTEDLATFSISVKREMGEGTPAEEELAVTMATSVMTTNTMSQGELTLGAGVDQHHQKDLVEDGANLETLPENKERLDDEEPASKYSHHSERESSATWSVQSLAQPENQEVAPPKVEVVPSSTSPFVQWQPGGVRQRSPEEGQEARSVAQQRSLGMASRKGAPSPRPAIGLASRPSHMVGSREDNRAPRPKYLQSRASPSPSNVSQQQSTVELLGSKQLTQQRPQTTRRSADDTPLPSDRNQYLETGQLRDEEEDEEDEDPCGPPSNQRPPPGLRRMVPGESSSPEAGGASASGSGICLPVADPDEMVDDDDDDDDVLGAVPIPSGPRVVPGVAEGEEENLRKDGVGQVPESPNSSSTAINTGVAQPVAEVPNAERSETIGSEGVAVPTLIPTHSRDPGEDRRGSYSRVESRRDVSAERERSVVHPKTQPSRVTGPGDGGGVSHISGGASGQEDEEEIKEAENRGTMGHHGRRRSGRVGTRGKVREEGELSEDEDGDDGSGRRSVEEREVLEKNRSRRRDHGKGYVSSKAERRGPRNDVDSGDDHLDERGGRDDGRREDKGRGGRGYDDQWHRRSRRRKYDQDADLDEDSGGYYSNHASHPPRRVGNSEWDRQWQHSVPPEERAARDQRSGGRHDYPSQDWSRDLRHRDWGPEDEYSRDYYNHRHSNSVSGRPPQPYYREGQRSRTNSQLDLGGNGYEGRPSSRGGEGYYSDTNRDGGWERRNRGPERGGAGLRRESGDRDEGDWHERDSRTPRHHYPHHYHHHLRREPHYYGGDPRYVSDSRQYSPFSPGIPYPGYDYYGHPLPPGQLPHHPYYNDPYRMQRDPYSSTYLYLEEMRRTRPHEYAEWYRKVYGRAGGSHAGVAGSTGTPGGRTPSASGGAGSPVGIPRSDAGGEGGHSLEEPIVGDDGRGSVHSGRSSLNLLQANMDDDSANGMKIAVDRSLGSPYRGTEHVSSRTSTPQRLTPAKFPASHIKGELTAHGSLLLLKPNYTLDGPSSTVEFLSLRELLKNDPMMAELEDFPGPLVRGTTHKNSVIQFCNSKINTAINDTSIHDRESYVLLWKLLTLLLKQNGFVVGTDISSLLLEDSAYLQNPTQGSVTGSTSPQLAPEELSSNSNLTTPDEGIVAGGPLITPTLGNRAPQFSEEYLTRKFREFLLFGNTRDALEWAMKHGLWGHAMFLAYKIGGRMLASVLTRFANNLPHNDPLQTLYQLLSGRQPAAITSCIDEKWGDWRPHLAMIISNSSSHPDLHRKSIITLGDTLAARGCLHASQFCYVIAQLNLGSSSSVTPATGPSEMNMLFTGPDARLVLLGSSVNLSRDVECNIPNEVVNCTEVLEYARSLADPNFFIPYFQPIKLEYAMRLVEHGMVQEGLLYCEVIACKVTSFIMSGGVDKTLDLHFLKRLAELSERLKHHDPVLERSESGSEEDPQWLLELNRCIKILIGQSDGLTTGIQQTNNMAGVYGTQPQIDMQAAQIPYGAAEMEGVANTQSEVTGQGVVQTGEYDAQWNNYYYEQAKWQQQQQQQLVSQTQQETTGGTVEPVAPSAMDSSQMTPSYDGAVWDSGNQTITGNGGNEGVNVGGESQDDVRKQSTSSIPSSQDINSGIMGGVVQQSSNNTMPVSDSGANNYWDMATNNDQSGRGVRREEEEEDDDDCEDEEDDEDTEEEEDDYEDEQPRKDVSGRQRQASGSNSSVRNWMTSEPSQKGRKETSELKSGGAGIPGNSGGGSGGGWLGGLLSKFSLRPKNQMNLPDDKNPSIVWDNEKKRWVNMDADEDEAATDLPPPPKAADLIPTMMPSMGSGNSLGHSGNIHSIPSSESIISQPAAPPAGNMYKMQKGRKMRQNYVDVMGNNSVKAGGRGNMPPPRDLFPTPAAPTPSVNFFVPAPVHDDSAPTDFLTSASTAENEVQESSEMSRSSSMSSLSREVQGFMIPDRRGHGISVGHRPMATAKPSMYQENQYHQQSNMHYQ